jgi:hypothetical protein
VGKSAKLPKIECCVSKSRCERCPIRMLKEGNLPDGYGVRKRVLVQVGPKGKPTKVNKSDLEAAIKRQSKIKKNKKKLAA